MTRRSAIPLYDATVPVACTADSEDLAARMELVERLRVNLERIERTEHGLRLEFPDRPDVEADVRRFVVDEKRCCQFWGFAVDFHDDRISLRWDAPPSVDEVVTRLLAYFRGDEPLTSLSGLL
jgi:hypothetical protein